MTTSPVMTVTDELLEELEWSAKNTCSYGKDDWFKPDDLRHDIGSDDAKYVADSSPFVMMALTAELRRLRAENAELAKDAGRWNYYAPTVAMMSGVSMKKMNEVIDDAMQTAMATK